MHERRTYRILGGSRGLSNRQAQKHNPPKIDFFAKISYVYTMRILATLSILSLAAAAALPASACDRHGGGLFGQLGGASWTDYDPATAASDAQFLEQQLSEWHKQNAVAPAEVKPAKPSFSSASNRAAKSAQARIQARMTNKMQAAKTDASSAAKFESTARPTLSASKP